MRLNRCFFVFIGLSLILVSGSSAGEDLKPALHDGPTGNIRGEVLFTGEVPAREELPIRGNPECASLHPGGRLYSETLLAQDGKLQNVFAYIKEGLEGRTFAPSELPVVIENKNCMYVPHVSGVQVGQPVRLLNEDPTLHNVHSYSKNSKPWNLGLPFQGMKQTKKFGASEIMVTLKCDVHPWMIGYVGVVSHPFFAVTGENGQFELKDVPPGEYVIEIWHEKLGTQTQKIQLGPQESKKIQFSYSG